MAQSIQHDRYPKFVADQVLTEKSLNQMFSYLEDQQRLTRTTLIGIGILCGMEVSVNDDGTELTISHGVGVTSKGYLVPFPETTYTFYNDEFSAEQEFFYEPFLNADTTQKFPLNLLHNDGAAEIQKPLTSDFLEDKVVVVFVELLKVDNKNCDPDSCDDKGCTVEVTHRPLLVAQEDIDNLIFGGDEDPFLHEPSCVEWPEIKMPKYNVPATLLLSSPAILKNFLNVLTSDFMLNVENVLGAAYASLGYYIKDEYPNNPFSGLKNRFSFLFNGGINAQQLLHVQYYFDFFSDLIMAYQELRKMCNDCLALCCPNEDLFPRHLILGNAIAPPLGFRHHWIQSPAFACDCCSEERIKFLLKKIALLIEKLRNPRAVIGSANKPLGVRITPSSYGSIPLSEKAIPYYYDIFNGPNELYDHWNFSKSKLGKGKNNLSYDADQYTNDPYFKDPLNYDLEPFNFLRVEGHIGMNWKNALAEVNSVRYQKRLPMDVVALNGDIFALIQSLLTSTNSLADLISGNKDIAADLRCYFADIESQYDAHAAELRCTIIKVMAYFYNLPKLDAQAPPVATTNLPQSTLVRKEFPNYRTFANTYGADFDAFYAPLKNQPYITPQAFMSQAATVGLAAQAQLLSPIYLMYYLEKIYEALPDGLVQLQINTLTQRLEDASGVAAVMLLALDNIPDFELPAMWEESLDAIIRICKADVFNVLFRNFLINYVLFIANQTFALYAFKNPGVQHKAGTTTGGTLILVYTDKPEIRQVALTNERRVVSAIDTDGPERFTPNGNFSTTRNSAEGDFGFSMNNLKARKSVEKAGRNPILDYRKRGESVKAEGLDDIFEIADAAGKDSFTDKELAALVNEFPEGTVIADFFVPNMCKSSCMAMNFIVMGDKEPGPGETNVRLDIKLREYCEDDDTDYEIKLAPEGGELKLDGTVVPTDEKFNPTNFKPDGNDASREVVITYTVNADVKNITVTVFKKPEISIAIDTKDDVNKVVTFKNDTKFADSYQWNFGNGQSSTDRDPGPISFGNLQTATVTLKAGNGPCQNESQPLPVSFEDTPDEERSCTPIGPIADKFKVLDEVSSDKFKDAVDGYALLVEAFINKFAEIKDLLQKEQFEKLVADLSISVIQKMLRILNAMVQTKPELRRFALMLYEVLLMLVQFYACCQNQDIDKAKVKTGNTLKIMVGHLSSWRGQIDFKDDEKEILQSMLEATLKEFQKTQTETPHKTKYIDFLKALVKILTELAV
ncbi:hypothetical protein FK220_001680 [Flavobacteriaceae bacterium TP-CH-4]|uniref:PKD domain-containing protein n=1 Tax=Pelagihabitans pacificus TaxID=2696054 RepID=A0A967AUW5_9FLAO|nr:hypothetical protein [Pelagihabitans pacificus]NHF58032.1 hypothetical protein [Pelagihabitans pacificus]